MYPYITLDTYSDLRFEDGSENTNYDLELREFTVPFRWVAEEFRFDNFGAEAECDLEYFLLEQYTWDDTFWLYERAAADGVIISERIVRRQL